MKYQLKVVFLGQMTNHYYKTLKAAREGMKKHVHNVAKEYISTISVPTHTIEKETPRSKKTITVTRNYFEESFGSNYYSLFDHQQEERFLYISGIIVREDEDGYEKETV